jgi:hypothetical protein
MTKTITKSLTGGVEGQGPGTRLHLSGDREKNAPGRGNRRAARQTAAVCGIPAPDTPALRRNHD